MEKNRRRKWGSHRRNARLLVLLLIGTLAASLTGLIGCGQDASGSQGDGGAKESSTNVPDSPLASVRLLAQGASDFELSESPDPRELAILGAFSEGFVRSALEGARIDGAENPVWSPVSAYLALMAVALGTEGETRAEFEEVFAMPADQWQTWSRRLMSYMNWSVGDAKVMTANSVWADQQVCLEDAYVQAVSKDLFADVYQGELTGTDAMHAINAWADEKTQGMIDHLRSVPYGPEVGVSLLNAVYLEQQWKEAFLKKHTEDKIFYTADNQEREVPFLQDPLGYREYVKEDSFDGILLPYAAGELAFVALRPTAGQSADELLLSLTTDRWKELADRAAEVQMNFSMPKFTLEYQGGLTEAMEGMGLKKITTDCGEDLTPMGAWERGESLGVLGIGQTVKIQVDEAGTKAAAVTEATMAASAPIPGDTVVELHLDRPFVYAILDRSSGLPLFVGVLDCPPALP